MISGINSKKEKKVLEKMVLMYIKENIYENIENLKSIEKSVEKSIEKIIEEVVEELLTELDSIKIKNDQKKTISIEMPLSMEESKEFICQSSALQQIVTYNNSSIIYKFYLFVYQKIKDTINNQDYYQRYNATMNILIELFRVITCSLMIIFIPQNCNDHVCSLSETIIFDSNLKSIGLVVNFITLLSFIFMYFIEIWRENRLIKYLDVNPNIPNDSEYIANIMDILPNDKKNKIINGNLYYMYISYLTFFIYFINAIISGIIINRSYLNNQTYATYLTYLLFMVNKLTNAYTVINVEENIFFSAYLKTNIQFNDIDRNYKKVIDF
jgi:hypothetical protein